LTRNSKKLLKRPWDRGREKRLGITTGRKKVGRGKEKRIPSEPG